MEQEILEILDKRDASKPKKTRTKKTEPKKKKLTKKELQIIEVAKSIVLPDNYHLVSTKEQFEDLIKKYKAYKETYPERPYVYLDTETYGVNAFKDSIISISIGFEDNTHYNIPVRPFKHPMSQEIPTLELNYVADTLRPLLENDYDLVLHNAKFDIHVLYNWMNIDITFNIAWDSMIAAGLLNENHPKGLKEWYLNYALPDLVAKGEVSQEELNKPTFKFGDMFEKIPFDEVPHNLATYYACHDTDMTRAVFRYQKEIFESGAFNLEKVYKLFKEVEMPLIPIMTIAERKGVKLDKELLQKEIGGALHKKLQEIQSEIYKILGDKIILKKIKTRQKNGIKFKEQYEIEEQFNLKSPSQLAQKLYDEHNILKPVMEFDSKLGQEVPKKKTDRKTLNKNKNVHPVIPLILEYRGLTKLIDAFTEKLPLSAEETFDGRVHTSYNTVGARTGRMSSNSPNLQQIPAAFKVIRYAFQADEGRLFASIDFSQQEVRILAALTQEETLLNVYKNGLDMHSTICCQINGFDYNMFEDIRNYKKDTEEETHQTINALLNKWEGTDELNYAIQQYEQKYGKIDYNNLIPSLASYFELSRKHAKSTTFGVLYGITSIGLSEQLGISQEEAQKLIDGFKAGLPKYLLWEKKTHEQLLKQGYVETILGRKRRFGEIIEEAIKDPIYRKTGRHWKIEQCKRQACNVQIQGSASDQVKKAMVDLFYPTRPDGTKCFDRREWVKNGYKSILEKYDAYIIMQIHDELLFDVPQDIKWTALEEIAKVMQNAIPMDHLGVTFKSDIEVSKYWGGSYTEEEIQKFNQGELDWKEALIKDVKKQLETQLGEEYVIGLFAEIDKDEEDDDDLDYVV